MSAVAVPPVAVAGLKAVRVMAPAAGTGFTPVMARSTTVSSGSVALTVRVAAVPAGVANAAHVSTAVRCPPSPSKVSIANPSHSAAGSKASVGLVSPASMVGFRRSVLSAVLVNPVPHSVPGSTPCWPIESITAPALRSRIASSPLNQPEPLVWSAWARIAGPAPYWATT